MTSHHPFTGVDRFDLVPPDAARSTAALDILESVGEAFAAFDRNWRCMYVNRRAAELLGKAVDELVGRSPWELFPFTVGSESFHNCHRAVAEQIAVRFETYVQGPDRWYESRLFPFEKGLAICCIDVTERKRAEEALREADRRKDEFLAVLSHELRNPMAPLSSAAHLLHRLDPSSNEARHARSVIERQVGHLSRLVDDLLDLTRIAHGKVKLRREKVRLNDIVRRAADDQIAVFRARGIDFRIAASDESLWVDGDPTRLAQIVANLLHNASKFTPEGGRVTLTLTGGPNAAEIRVHDTGAGIDPDLLPRLFEPFLQGTTAMAHRNDGLGLGLALVKGLLDLHGGNVFATSAGAGQGSEFVVRVPTVAPAPHAPGLKSTAKQRARRSHVLVVEDNVDAAETLAQLLQMSGHTVDVALDGPSALAKARGTLPDVILCDIGLPGMSGYELARVVRSDRALAGVRLVALSGYARPEDRLLSADAGFDEHFGKPLRPGDLDDLLACA